MECDAFVGICNSHGLGVNFLPAKGFKRGPPRCVETTFSYRYCRLKTVMQWCIAKNTGGHTLEMRDRRCRAAIAEGARIEAPKAPRGVLGEGVSPQPTSGSGERRELPQRGPGRSPGHQRILGIFQRLRRFLVEGF